MTDTVKRADGLWLAGLVVALVGASAWLTRSAGVELHFDEAQYWTWSQRLDWSYYSKGPLIAWLIAVSTGLFGHGEWQVRLLAWVAHGVFLLLVFAFARDVWQDRRAAWWAVALCLMTPIYFTLGMVMTTDVLLFVFWTWGLWAAYRALYRERRRAWYEFGAAVGLGALAKLSIGLLAVFVAAVVVLTPRGHRHLKEPHLWLAAALTLTIMSPELVWNAQHHWMMFHHEMGHIETTTWSIARVFRFIGGQLIGLSPVVVLLLLSVLYRPPERSDLRFLWSVTLMGVVFFTLKSLSAKVQMNWPAPVYIGLLVVFAGYAAALTGTRRGILLAGLATSVLLAAVCYFPADFGVPGGLDPFKDTKGWKEPIRQLSRRADPDFILSRTYKMASELAFYWPRRLPVYVTGNAQRRYNQFDLWSGLDREAGRTGLYVSAVPDVPPELARAFDRCSPLPPVTAHAPDGAVIRVYYARLCRDYRPIQWPQPSYY